MRQDLIPNIIAAGALLALALGATYARRLGYVDGDTLTRLVMGGTGLMLAWYGNRMPKVFAPTEAARRVARVGGWSLALSGLAYAGVWAFAPFQTALILGCSAVMAGMAVTIGYCMMQWRRVKAA